MRCFFLMKKIFLVFVVIFIFINLVAVSAQDNDSAVVISDNNLIESSDLSESAIGESPAVSIETHVSENSIYIGNQTEVSVTVRNVGNVDIDNLTILESASTNTPWMISGENDLIWLTYTGYSQDYEALNLSAFESSDYWDYNISNYHQLTHNFILKDTLKINESSSFKLIYNSSKSDFYKNSHVCLFAHLNYTLLNETSDIINISPIPRDFHINRKIENNSLTVDVTVSSLDNSIFSGSMYIDVIQSSSSSFPFNYFHTPIDPILFINNTGYASFELPIKVYQDYATGLIPEDFFTRPQKVYSNNFIFDDFDVNSILDVYCLYIDAKNLVKYYKNDSQFVVKTFVNSQKNVTFKINGVSYLRSIDDEGYAKLNINLNPGVYTIEIMGYSYYYKNFTKKVTVLPTLAGDNLIKYYKNDSQFHIKLVDHAGNPVKSADVMFNINGVFYYRETNADGIAKLNINLNPGEYVLTAVDPLTGLHMSYNITVLSRLSGEDVFSYPVGSYYYGVKLVDDVGNLMSGQLISFNINGVIFTNLTDANGEAKLFLNLMSGKYIVTAQYLSNRISNVITII